MANLKNILFSALLLCGLASCRNTDENAGSPVTGYDTEVSAECLSSLISDFECLQLECKPECLLTNINKIEMTDSLLIIPTWNISLHLRKMENSPMCSGQKGMLKMSILSLALS